MQVARSTIIHIVNSSIHPILELLVVMIQANGVLRRLLSHLRSKELQSILRRMQTETGTQINQESGVLGVVESEIIPPFRNILLLTEQQRNFILAQGKEIQSADMPRCN